MKKCPSWYASLTRLRLACPHSQSFPLLPLSSSPKAPVHLFRSQVAGDAESSKSVKVGRSTSCREAVESACLLRLGEILETRGWRGEGRIPVRREHHHGDAQ
ncbi:hypothetical protein E2C01_094247 [Portunus trituberculatus]|uniref:Uncharacterized protein n=1 Tax=Portunus trituberculatus TaxID=210409 RepID=A0A5B7JRY4_PORTR|nr:hypothetical protein [Portunus trituberculatus]